MGKSRIIHLKEAKPLSNFLSKEEHENIVSLKMTEGVREVERIYRDLRLFIPNASVAFYKQALGWKCYKVKEIKNNSYGMGCSRNRFKA